MKSLFVTLLALATLSAWATAAVEVNGIAAKVNGNVITKNEVAVLLAPNRAYLSSKYPIKDQAYQNELKEARENIIKELIDRELVLHHFKNELGGALPEAAIESEIQRRINRDYNGKDSLFREELGKQGISYRKYKDLVRRSLIVQAMKSRQFSSVAPPTPQELRAEYNEIKTELRDTTKDRCDFEKMYIPRTNPDDLLATPESQLALAESIVRKVKNGADFGELAREHSADAFAEDGGVQKNYARTDLSPAIAQHMFEAPTGTVIGPLADQFGYHIIRCTQKHYGPTPSLQDDKIRDIVENNVRREKSSARYERWISRLRRTAMIERRM